MNLGELQSRAQILRRQPMTPSTKSELEGLRQSAVQAGPVVAQAFDRQLQALFADVYGGAAPPPVAVTRAGAAQNAGFGGAMGSALQFHALKDPAAVAKSVTARVPTLKTTTPLPIPLEKQFPALSSSEKAQARKALEGELASAKVRVEGRSVSVLDKLKAFPGLDGAQKERVLDLLAEVKAGYERVGQELGAKPGGTSYQDVNWKHTRLEVDRVLDVVTAGKLTPRQAEAALLASIVSDAVKTPGNFLVHNVHGAQAAVMLLARQVPPPSAELIEDVAKATLEHQIGPPGFMANVALRNALKGAGADAAAIATICEKVAQPFEARNLTADKSQIAFTDVEKAALAKVGVFAWTVPHEGSRHYKASRAVIDGDSLVNYACPDGWAKLAALHGPGQPVFLQEPRLVDGLVSELPQHASALKSFRDALSVVSPESQKLYKGGLVRTQLAIDRVLKDLDRWVVMQPQKDIPRTKDGKVPYLDGALDYMDGRQVAFATRLRDEAVRLLREQESL